MNWLPSSGCGFPALTHSLGSSKSPFLPVSYSSFNTHYYPHCALPPVISVVPPDRSIILPILPFRPPGCFSFLVWPGITQKKVVNGPLVSAYVYSLRACVKRKRRRRKLWVEDERQMSTSASSFAGCRQYQAHKD